MGLDSVEILMCWEETFGIRIEDSEAAELRTPRQAIDLISKKLNAIDISCFCPTLRAFHVFRSGVRQATSQFNRRIGLRDHLRDLHKDQSKREFWNAFRKAVEIPDYRPPGIIFAHATVQDAIEKLIAHHLKHLLKPSEKWTRSLVRFGVRYGVIEVVGAREFSDDDRFVEDIGVA